MLKTARQALNACGFDGPFNREKCMFVLWFLFSAGLVLVAASWAGHAELISR